MTDIGVIFENIRGETAALASAFLWASATVLFGRAGKRVQPLELNLVKGVIAIALIVLTLVIRGNLLTAIEPLAIVLLFLSGVIGIGIGDTAYFDALNCLGARRTLLLMMLSPPLAGLVAQLALGETLGTVAWIGVLLTALGVAWVVTERQVDSGAGALRLKRGVTMGFVAALGQALGAVLARAALTETAINPLWSALIRLSSGVVCLMLWIAFCPPRSERFSVHHYRSLWRIIVFATFIGTYLAIWLQQVSLKFTSAGIAQTLFSTSPLFVLPMAACMGEKVSLRAVVGVVVALFGIAMLFGILS